MANETKRTRRTAEELIAHLESRKEELRLRGLKSRAPKAKLIAEEIEILARHAGEERVATAALDLARELGEFLDRHDPEPDERSLQS